MKLASSYFLPVLGGCPAGNCFLVEGMENAAALDFRHPGDARQIRKLIHHHRVDNIGGDVKLIGYFSGNKTAQRRRVLALNAAFQVLNHAVVDDVCAAGNGFYHSAAANHRRQFVEVDALAVQALQDNFLAYWYWSMMPAKGCSSSAEWRRVCSSRVFRLHRLQSWWKLIRDL